MARPLCILAFALALVLAGPVLADGDDAPVRPLGPGAVFDSIQAAALDGLAFAHQESVDSRNPRLSRGGAVVRVEQGFSYGPLVEARPADPDRLYLRLGEDAVAHFHTYPKQHAPIDRRNETHSPADRAVVDVHDDLHRPSYVLTPSLRVVVYRGRHADERSDIFVASLGELREQRLAGR